MNSQNIENSPEELEKLLRQLRQSFGYHRPRTESIPEEEPMSFHSPDQDEPFEMAQAFESPNFRFTIKRAESFHDTPTGRRSSTISPDTSLLSSFSRIDVKSKHYLSTLQGAGEDPQQLLQNLF